jgi:hypothetical protein
MKPLVLAVASVLLALALPRSASSQAIEVIPLAGYRFNNDLFEFAANRPVDADGAPLLGGAVNVEIERGLWFEALFTHQQADVAAPRATPAAPAQSRAIVDQWLAGGRQEFSGYPARPFFSGLLGLTRYGVDGDYEVRFTFGAGGGVEVPLQRRIGLRFDSRVFTTFVDLDARAGVCGGGGCALAVAANVVWQIEFTAGLVIVF